MLVWTEELRDTTGAMSRYITKSRGASEMEICFFPSRHGWQKCSRSPLKLGSSLCGSQQIYACTIECQIRLKYFIIKTVFKFLSGSIRSAYVMEIPTQKMRYTLKHQICPRFTHENREWGSHGDTSVDICRQPPALLRLTWQTTGNCDLWTWWPSIPSGKTAASAIMQPTAVMLFK